MKKTGSKFRKVIAVAVILTTLLFLLFVFSATQSALDVWDRLQALPEPLFYTYTGIILVIVLFSFWLVYKLLKPNKINEELELENVTEENVLKELDHADDVGMETTELRREIEQLQERKDSGRIYVALFGDVSTGKSSIVKALLPDAKIDINVRGGSTQEIKQYTWKSTSGDELVLTDLPGRNEADGSLDMMAQEEAVRAQVVVYVTDSDLSRTQFEDIKQLQSFGKPMIVALNKSDRFNDEEKELINSRFSDYFKTDDSVVDSKQKSQYQVPSIKQVFVQSGGEEEILKIYPDGREAKIIRERKADVSALAEALQDEIDKQGDVLETLRDASVFVLVKQKLDSAKEGFRQEKAESIIRNSTRKAVFGALAAISPGSDLVIQGVLGHKWLKVCVLCITYLCVN